MVQPGGSPVEFEEYKQSYVAEVEQSIDFSGQSHDFFIRVKADELIASHAVDSSGPSSSAAF